MVKPRSVYVRRGIFLFDFNFLYVSLNINKCKQIDSAQNCLNLTKVGFYVTIFQIKTKNYGWSKDEIKYRVRVSIRGK